MQRLSEAISSSRSETMHHDLGDPLSPREVVRSGLCIGCGSCVAQAHDRDPAARMRLDGYGNYRPQGSPEWLRMRTSSFARTCPFSPSAQNEDDLAEQLFPDAEHRANSIGRFQTAYVGYVAEESFRELGSSGGMVSWVLAELLRKGLVDGVAHVTAGNKTDSMPNETHAVRLYGRSSEGGNYFRYGISRSVAEVHQGAKSRYYPVELSDVLRSIRLVPGRYAVVGVPCFIKAINLLRLEDALIRERVVFTLGLFCGHMKSARLVESFAWQMGVTLDEVQHVEFRLKDPGRPASWYTAHLTLRDGRTLQKDWWNLADGDWGAGFFQNSACNFCDDVVSETADISFGDAWVEPYSSDGRGTNVVIVRSPVLQSLVSAGIREGRLRLDPVDEEFVEQTQAAGFRQRREGLAYRLTWLRTGVRPRKRVAHSRALPFRRKLIYRMRSSISAWSHRVFRLARAVRQPKIYIWWARAALTVYHGLAYSRGRLGYIVERLGLKAE